MGNYNKIERTAAKILDAFPTFKKILKAIYQRVNYSLYKEKGFTLNIHEDIKISSALQIKGDYFFGYYDRSPWSVDMKKMIFHKLEENNVEIILFDIESGEINVVENSVAFNFQQGSLITWINNNEFIFVDEFEGGLSAKIYNVESHTTKIVPLPVQTINNKSLLSINYSKLYDITGQYGYPNKVENFSKDLPLDKDGIWHNDVNTKKVNLLISLDTLCENEDRKIMGNAKQKINHVMYSPSGNDCVFMHRWLGGDGKYSRLYVSDRDGKRLKILFDDRMVSHYSWKDNDHLIVWARTKEFGDRYYLVNVRTGDKQIIGEGVLDQFGDGHPSYSPNERWII